MQELISVIIPIYNTEAYLEKCVNSITAQTYQNLEIILMDDGSPDNSGAICDALAEEDERIRVIHAENRGVSKARYHALLNAKGAYVTFIDSDDFADPDYISCLYDAIKEFSADASTCAYREVYDNGIIKDGFFAFPNGNICLSAQKTFEWIYYEKKCSTALCCKMFRTELLKTFTPSDLALGEDSYICQKYFFNCRRIAHTGKVKYSYYQRETSAIHSYADARFYDYVKLYDMLEEDCRQFCPEASSAYRNKLMENNFVAFLRIYNANGENTEEIQHISENIKKYRKDIIRDRSAEKRTRIASLISYCGMDTVAKCYRIFDRLK